MLFEVILNLPEEHRKTFHTALMWYCEGLKTGYEVTSFNAYWNAVEILAFKYFNKLNLKDKDEVKIEKIQENLKTITPENCLKTIGECSKIINESVPGKFRKISGMFMSEEDVNNLFFKKLENSKYSLYTIRNYISHGNVTEIQFDKHGKFKTHVYKMSQASKKMILLMLNNMDKLK